MITIHCGNRKKCSLGRIVIINKCANTKIKFIKNLKLYGVGMHLPLRICQREYKYAIDAGV